MKIFNKILKFGFLADEGFENSSKNIKLRNKYYKTIFCNSQFLLLTEKYSILLLNIKDY